MAQFQQGRRVDTADDRAHEVAAKRVGEFRNAFHFRVRDDAEDIGQFRALVGFQQHAFGNGGAQIYILLPCARRVR